MSKIRPPEKTSVAKEKSYGPCFIIVDDDNPLDAHPWCISSDHEPTPGEVRATAEKVVRLSVSSLKRRYRWERYNEADMDIDGPRGKEALSAACDIIRAGPDTKGKDFLAGGVTTTTIQEVVAKKLTMPAKRYKSVAQQVREMYLAPKIAPAEKGPKMFDPNENPVEED